MFNFVSSKIDRNWMKEKFDVLFLDQAIDFIESLDSKSRKKIIYNIDKAKYVNDPKLFKKLNVIFGSLEQNLVEFNIDYLRFGINLITKRL